MHDESLLYGHVAARRDLRDDYGICCVDELTVELLLSEEEGESRRPLYRIGSVGAICDTIPYSVRSVPLFSLELLCGS